MLIYSGHCEIAGGDAKYLADLVSALGCRGQAVSVVTDRNSPLERFTAQNLGVPVAVSYLNTRPSLFRKSRRQHMGRFGRGIMSALLLSRLRDCVWNFILFYRLLKNGGATADIFHFNNGGYPAKEAGLMALLAARLLGKKTVMTFHNMPVRRTWLRPSDFLFDHIVSRYCDCVIAASETLKQAIVNERKLDPGRVCTIYCGLEDQAPLSQADCLSLRRDLTIPEGAPVLLICGNLDEDRKGHVPLLHALRQIKDEFPDAVLLVVGTGSEERVRHIRKVAHDLGVDDAVRFLGFRRDIHAINCMSDIAVVPSLLTEATPYTIKEAARAARPVVTTFVGGCAEGVEEGETGFVVAPGDPDALARAILRLLRDPALRCAMGRSAREFFLQKFLLSEKVKQHEDIYARLRGLQ